MSRKKIGGSMASSMMDAAAHLATIEEQFSSLQWKLCYRTDLAVDFGSLRSMCRKLSQTLEMADLAHRADAEEEAEAEKQPALRQVK